MKSFFIDTATKNSTIALLNDFEIIDLKLIEADKNLSNCLFVHIQDLFSRNELLPEEIDKIFVSIGPGSFTGVRIGLTIAKTWASLYNISLYPISSLEILASVNNESSCSCAMIDARRNYVYAGIYDDSLNSIFKDSYISLDEIFVKAKKMSATFCTCESFEFPTMIVKKADIEKVIKKHSKDNPVNPHTLTPLYLKLTEAEERLKNV